MSRLKKWGLTLLGVLLVAQLASIQMMLYMLLTQPPSAIDARMRAVQEAREPIADEAAPRSHSGRELDWTVNGPGFFELLMPEGNTVYTRDGRFTLSPDGTIVTRDEGFELQPSITVPETFSDVKVAYNGIVTCLNDNSQPMEIGQVTLVRFRNPEGLKSWHGRRIFVETDQSGSPTQGVPAQEGMGIVEQGYVEAAETVEASAGLGLPNATGESRE